MKLNMKTKIKERKGMKNELKFAGEEGRKRD